MKKKTKTKKKAKKVKKFRLTKALIARKFKEFVNLLKEGK